MSNQDDKDDKNLELTNRQGHPVTNNQSIRSVGNRGPTTLVNYDFLEKVTHFDRERIPERVVHARGAGAHGYFQSYGTLDGKPISEFTRAKVFTNKDHQTPVFVRFSTVVHGGQSPETLRDPRGFAVKFYTEDGNWDLVGNNLKIFFIRDPIKFPDMVHSFKPDPVTNVNDMERMFDFLSQSPESTHMVTFLFSPWGIPASYREMVGSGVHAYRWVNSEGKSVLVKYHWEPVQGVRNLTQAEADEIQKVCYDHATRDLFDQIEQGNFPEWEMYVQIMEDHEHPELDFDPLDPTKLWPKDKFPWHKVGKMVLNKNPENYFSEVEQVAFGTGVLVDGMDFSDDKLLQGRTFSYSDTQRYRVGTNYLQLPINAPKKHIATNYEGGAMNYRIREDKPQNPHVNYEPSSLGGLHEAKQDHKDFTPFVEGRLVREKISRENNFAQAGGTYRSFEKWEQDELINNLSSILAGCSKTIQDLMVSHFTEAEEEYGKRVAEGIKKYTDSSKQEKMEETVKHASHDRKVSDRL